MKKILVIEDEKDIQNIIKAFLENADYKVETADDGLEGINLIQKNSYDLVLLDIMMPKIDGFVVCEMIRKNSNIPIIILTALTDEESQLKGFDKLADDYITKPYNPTILLLRINNLFKRIENKNDILTYNDLTVDPKKGIIKSDKEELILTKNEMIIFTFLLANRGNIVTRDDLMTDLWNNDSYINDNALNVNISRLRTKLTDFGYEDAIETRKGQGYILK